MAAPLAVQIARIRSDLSHHPIIRLLQLKYRISGALLDGCFNTSIFSDLGQDALPFF